MQTLTGFIKPTYYYTTVTQLPLICISVLIDKDRYQADCRVSLKVDRYNKTSWKNYPIDIQRDIDTLKRVLDIEVRPDVILIPPGVTFTTTINPYGDYLSLDFQKKYNLKSGIFGSGSIVASNQIPFTIKEGKG